VQNTWKIGTYYIPSTTIDGIKRNENLTKDFIIQMKATDGKANRKEV
jgi:hypothetical protein